MLGKASALKDKRHVTKSGLYPLFRSGFLVITLSCKKMTKAELANIITIKTGIDRKDVMSIVESLMAEVKNALEREEPVYMRGFGSFIIKRRAEKTARNISRNTTLIVPAHNIPAFKPAKEFVQAVSEAQNRNGNDLKKDIPLTTSVKFYSIVNKGAKGSEDVTHAVLGDKVEKAPCPIGTFASREDAEKMLNSPEIQAQIKEMGIEMEVVRIR